MHNRHKAVQEGGGQLFSPFLCCLGTGSAESGSPSTFHALNATAENGDDEEGNSPTK